MPYEDKRLYYKKYIDVNIIRFIEQFPDEASCKDHLRGIIDYNGIRCKTCGCEKHYWLKSKFQWQFSECGFRTTLRSGTMFENSNLSLRKWYIAMAFMIFSKKGLSVKELQRQLEHARYRTVWSMMHRIREAMGKRDNLYNLEGTVEFDEGYFLQKPKRKTNKT